MIGGLLRFAPGRLGARQDRAPRWCGIRWGVVSWLPYLPRGTSSTPEGPRAVAESSGAVTGPGWQPAAQTLSACVNRGWLKGEGMRGQAGLACWRYPRWLVLRPGCAAEGMAVPLAVKDLRPLRGAFGVLDREPLARHRQMEGQARGLPQGSPRSPVTGGSITWRSTASVPPLFRQRFGSGEKY